MSAATFRGGKRKLASAEENSDAAENSSKNEGGKAVETKRPKRQTAAVDKAKVIVVYSGCFGAAVI